MSEPIDWAAREREPCRKGRSGLGGGFMCVTHRRTWPCSVAGQAAEQLELLARASPLGPAVIAEIAAERLHQLATFDPDYDREKAAVEWLVLLGNYLERAAAEAQAMAQAGMLGESVDAAGWRRRLLQVAAISAAAVEAVDRMSEEGN